MAPLYFILAFAGVLGGGVMIASSLGMHWQGTIAILVGAGAFCFGIRDLRRSEPATPEEPTGNGEGPWRPEDFDNPRIVLASSGVSLFRQPNQIDGDPDGSGFVVGYGDYISPVLITDDVGRLQRGRQLALALQASPGADTASPTAVDRQNISGLLEDDFVRYECRLRLSPENVLALRGTRFLWTDEAERLAASVTTSAEAVEAVRQKMAELAREGVRIHSRFSTVIRQLSAAEKGSAEAVALSAELTSLMASRGMI